MKKLLLSAALLACVASANAQIVINTSGLAITENFNTATATVPAGWAFSESGTNANALFASGTGSSNAGDTYFFGNTNEWAFGGLQSGSLIPTVGVSFTNNIGAAITTLLISYTGETWRVGTADRSDRLDFQYSLDATSLTTGTWTDFNSLDYQNPGQSTGNGSMQHNLNISSTISSLSIANGQTFWLRWTDFNATGADDGMAVDNFSLTATAIPEPSTYALIGLGLAGLIALRRFKRTA